MRKVYKKRDEDAVSPVIATILMVAITVVLAAVLYVMVIGMGGGTSKTAPAGSITFTQISGTAQKITFGTFSPVPSPTELKIILTPTTGNPIELAILSIPLATPNPTNLTGAAGSATGFVATGWATYYDYQPTGNAVNAGDYLSVYGLVSGTYTVTIFHSPSSSTCSLVGSTSFTQP
jgi:flagellin-like protein